MVALVRVKILESTGLPCATLLMQSKYLFPFSSYIYCPNPFTIFSGSSLKNNSTQGLKMEQIINRI